MWQAQIAGLPRTRAELSVPTVAVVYGMMIMFYYDDHEPPHFHVRSADFRARFDLATLSVSEANGRIRPQDVTRIRDWARAHKVALEDNWNRARRKQPLVRIED